MASRWASFHGKRSARGMELPPPAPAPELPETPAVDATEPGLDLAPPQAPPAADTPPAGAGPDMHQLGAECLLAVVGLKAFLTSSRPIRLTDQVREDATALPFRWRTQIRGFLRAQEWAAEEKLPAWDYDEIAEAVLREQTPEELGARLDLGDAELTLALQAAAARALGVVREVLPARGTVGLLGAEPAKASGLELARLRLVWCTLDRPDMLLRDLDAGMLTSRQVDAFDRAYPALGDLLAKLVTNEAVRLREERTNMSLGRAREAQLGVLLGVSSVNPDLAAKLQANFADPASMASPDQQAQGGGPGGPPPAKPLSTSAPMLSTASQQVAGG